jgi:CDP-diacylglycerol--serine O-phosphatidyltransferase
MGAPRRSVRRGMFLLPGLFTVGNIFCGYGSIVRSTTGDFEAAALLILFAALLDALDGRVARATGTSSEFGVQLDSIADVVSFGVAPAVLMFSWAFSSFGRIGWTVSFLFVICGAMRLARFNLQRNLQDRRYFVGMPIPAAACILAVSVYAHPQPPDLATEPHLGVPLLVLVVLVSLLMVSRVKYRSFKDLDLRARRSHLYLLIPAILLALLVLHPQAMMVVAGLGYLVSGLIPRKRIGRREQTGAEDGGVEQWGKDAP